MAKQPATNVKSPARAPKARVEKKGKNPPKGKQPKTSTQSSCR